MSGTQVVLAGDEERSAALREALSGWGIEARFHGATDLAGALVALESDLEERRPTAAVSVGTGPGALALAITAAKLGVPVAALPDATPDGDRADEGRILATLAALDAGAQPVDAARSIAAWLEGL